MGAEPMIKDGPEPATISADAQAVMPKRAEPVRKNKRVRKAPKRLPGLVTGATALKAVGNSTKEGHTIRKKA